MKTDRLFQILYLLLEKKKISAPKLARQLGVSTRTIYRDIDSLSACGIPVYTLTGKNGGVALLPEYQFDKSFLSDKEQDEILFALQSVQASGQNMTPLLSKLGNAFRKNGRNWIEVDFSRWGLRTFDSERFHQIKYAILEKQLLEIDYHSSSGERTRRRIKPLRLIFKSKNWYLQAYCLKADDFRTFKLNRICLLTPSGEYFTETFDTLPSISAYSGSQEEIRIRLQFMPSHAFLAYDEFSAEEVEPQPDGSVIVHTSLPQGNWISGYLLALGTGVKILEPVSLKENLKEYLKEIQKHLES